jgi:hypothetical protein
LVTVALVPSLLVQVPPVVGDNVIVVPTHTEAPALTTGNAFTVTDDVVALQPVAVIAKVKVALPAATPVTTPALVTVALVASLLIHVPPVVGDNVIVLPTHTEAPAVTVGKGFTVYVPDVTVEPFVTETVPDEPVAGITVSTVPVLETIEDTAVPPIVTLAAVIPVKPAPLITNWEP